MIDQQTDTRSLFTRYRNILIGVLAVSVVFGTACQDEARIPKVRSYPRVVYPVKEYILFDTSFCRFSFMQPVYTEVQQVRSFFEETAPDACWFDLYYPAFDGRVHFSYVPISGPEELEALRDDAFRMANEHTVRANYIDERVVSKPNGVSGLAFEMDGPSASAFQFFLTDSTRHYLRGALYFNTQSRPDSLAPVIDFVKKDLFYIIETFEWKN